VHKIVTTVSPGFIETDAATRMIQRMADKNQSDYATARQKLMEMLGGIPLGRPNRPEEWQNLWLFSHRTELPSIREAIAGGQNTRKASESAGTRGRWRGSMPRTTEFLLATGALFLLGSQRFQRRIR
jgi:NAD(P)-dependent dehydrogenase (short-subunit alcohol dehydrogenase family)